MPTEPVSAYDALLALVDRKVLSITFVLGLARGGTTAFEKLLHEQLAFDAIAGASIDFGFGCAHIVSFERRSTIASHAR